MQSNIFLSLVFVVYPLVTHGHKKKVKSERETFVYSRQFPAIPHNSTKLNIMFQTI